MLKKMKRIEFFVLDSGESFRCDVFNGENVKKYFLRGKGRFENFRCFGEYYERDSK